MQQQQSFHVLVKELGLELTAVQYEQLVQFRELLIAANQTMNLTAIIDPEEINVKHFYDSFTVSSVVSIPDVKTMVDVGTGAGFPGIPLKIVFPHLKLVLVDSLKKRIHFLQDIVNQLNLKHVTCLHGRAETLAHQPDMREQFDLVTARAVSKLNTLAEYCLPFAKVDGVFVAMKGPIVNDELKEAEYALSHLGNSSSTTHSFELPNQHGQRTVIQIHKTKRTPKVYPRRPGIPQRQPLKRKKGSR